MNPTLLLINSCFPSFEYFFERKWLAKKKKKNCSNVPKSVIRSINLFFFFVLFSVTQGFAVHECPLGNGADYFVIENRFVTRPNEIQIEKSTQRWFRLFDVFFGFLFFFFCFVVHTRPKFIQMIFFTQITQFLVFFSFFLSLCISFRKHKMITFLT